ncbi:acyl transferase/acyl hydrolase/lysophospholipase [Flagelloscypha sp. PMI_526]|nr:acyl transferase/acyl hydrolase/lysophospholipase [Flagelloscypha sp. PMI_526]
MRRVGALSLDGGTLLVLSELFILRETMARLACVLNLDSIPFPYNHFDVIGGSGAGGILAIFLGRLRMSVDEAIEHFIDLYRTIMHPELDKATRSRKLVQYFKDLAQDHRMAELRPSCNVFVCAMPAACVTGRKPERFRNYTPRKFSSFDCKIWEAARATTADPSLFESMFIGPNWGPEEYVDPSGFGFGNPIDLVLEETKSLFSPHPQTLLLSLGAGHSGVFSLSRDGNELNSLFKAISEDCERTASKMEERDLEGYYRFNVAQGFQGIEPNDLSKPGVIAAHTKQHLGNFLIDRSLDEVVDFLAARYRQPASSPRALSQINPHIENLLLQIQTLNIFDFLLDRELVARPDYTFYTGRVYAEKRMLIQKFHGHTPYEDRDRALQSHILVRHPNLLAVFRKADDIPCIFYLNDNLIPAEERLARALELMDASELAHQGICLIGGLASGLDFLERNARQFLHGILHVQSLPLMTDSTS